MQELKTNQEPATQLAHQGELIAKLLNQALGLFGIMARVRYDQYGLQIMLEGEPVPEQQACTTLVTRGLRRLNLPNLDKVRVHGRLPKQDWPEWTSTIALSPTEAVEPEESVIRPEPAVPIQPIPTAIPVEPDPLLSPAWTWRHGLGGFSVILGLLGGAWGMNRWHQEAIAQVSEPSSGSPTANPMVSPSPDLSPDSSPSLSPNPSSSPSPSPSPSLTPTPAAASLSIKAVGDIIPGTNFPDYRLPDKQPQILFAQVQPLLTGADVLFGNYESTLTTHARTPKNVGSGRSFAFRTPPVYARILRRFGFDILCVANNHSFDFDLQGFKDTIRHIQAAGMAAIGQKGQIYYRDIKGIRTAWIGFSTYPDHNSILDIKSAQALIRKAHQNAAVVIVTFHGGAEGSDQTRTRNVTEFFYSENRGNVVNFSRRAIEAGADLVLGHGPHVPRALELYQNRLIAYSLGNFVGYETLSTDGVQGDSLVLQVQLDQRGKFLKGQILPVRLNNQGIPAPDPNGNSIKLIRQLTQLDFPKTPLQISPTGDILPVAPTTPTSP